MALPAKTYQAAVIQSHDGKQMANVISMIRSGSAQTEETVAQSVADAWTASNSFADIQTEDIAYVEIRVRNLSDGLAEVVIPWGDTGDTGTGNVAGDPVDPGSCLLYTLRSSLAGKSFRGRLYLGGAGRIALTSFSTAWDFTTSPGPIFAAGADTFMEELAGASVGFQLAVHSRKLETATVVSSTVARSSICSQNQRARRYGVV